MCLQACDLCYRKRIKCDGKTPRCSQCQLYDSQCTHQAVSRRKKPPHNEQYLPVVSMCLRDEHQELPVEDGRQLSTGFESSSLAALPATELDLPWNPDFPDFESLVSTDMPLPAETIVRPLVDTFLADFNVVLPLFDPQQLVRMVDQWYSSPMQRTRTSWAVINVVMAISQYCITGQFDHGNTDFSIGSSVSHCLGNAQSVLTELLMGDVELANLQVVLGLVIVFQATSDVKPAVFLMSTAIRLSQVLGIHRSDSYIYRNASRRDALQYERVFWITYILDRNIALRIRQAPIQQDRDISIELPPVEPDEDDAGFVSTPETHQNGFNVFRAHVELSQIQGYVYDALFSIRASRLSPGELAVSSQGIRLLLKDWKNRLPATLGAQPLSRTENVLPCVTSMLCMLYGTVITCLGLLCQVNSMDFLWIDRLRDYGRSITNGLGEPCVPPPQPQGWNALVNECREFMPLFMSVQHKGSAFMWTNICPYTSALICISANSIINFDNRDSLEKQDRRLKLEALTILRDLQRQTNHKTLIKVLEAFEELDSQYRLMTTT
ncbi:fungal-specific transcription factor domain-containing protein [Phaeosphaeria sp. MPI-PUGE-AT-0046c]|nr:fungal-specific transcription factor domain-containing protein [Phaeosphaeria sp. MPI-PUGE-AT-0046c]